MNKKVNALLQWIKREDGGRMLPPTGPCFYAVGWFPEYEKRHEEAWSLKIEFISQPDDSLTQKVKVSFLFDEAPDLLHPNCIFELYDGRKLVATGKIVKSSFWE